MAQHESDDEMDVSLLASYKEVQHEGHQFVCVALGSLYADQCSVCGKRGCWGLATVPGQPGCVEALKSGKIFCDLHLPKPYGRYAPELSNG